MKPWGIGVDSIGNVYVGDQENPVIQKFDNDGNFITKWGSYGSKAGQFVHIHDITLDSTDYVYVTDIEIIPELKNLTVMVTLLQCGD